MRLTPPPLDLAEYDGFNNTDLFGYREFADRLSTIVNSIDHSTVIMLDGAWGSGKSTFVRQWIGLLSSKGHQVILFDAFKNDHQDEPFFALAAEIYEHIRKNSPPNALTFKSKAASVGWFSWSLGTRFAVKFATMRNLSYADIPAATQYAKKKRSSKQDIENSALEDLIIDGLEEHIDQMIEKKKCVRQFRDILEKSVHQINKDSASILKLQNEGSRKLVLIVDELDRCMPLFALQLLERIKHIFSVKETCFVIVTHVRKLEETVESVYGITDGERYLEKFYDVRVRLPSVGEKPSYEKRGKYLKYLLETMEIAPFGKALYHNITATLLPICHMHDVELRSLEKIVTNLALCFLSGAEVSNLKVPVVSAVSAIRVLDSELYKKFQERSVEYFDIEKFMRFDHWPKDLERDYGGVRDYWKLLLGAIVNREDMRNLNSTFGIGMSRESRRPFLFGIFDEIEGLR